MPESNAVEYARREDKVTDIREEYLAVRNSIRITTTCLVVSLSGMATTVTYGGVVDPDAVLPPVLFCICLVFTFISALLRTHINTEEVVVAKKKLRDAEREFKYWSIENPPC